MAKTQREAAKKAKRPRFHEAASLCPCQCIITNRDIRIEPPAASPAS